VAIKLRYINAMIAAAYVTAIPYVLMWNQDRPDPWQVSESYRRQYCTAHMQVMDLKNLGQYSICYGIIPESTYWDTAWYEHDPTAHVIKNYEKLQRSADEVGYRD